MSRLWIATIATVAAALGVAPAAAEATVTSSQITSWTSSEAGTPANSQYLISLDNPPNATKLTVAGRTNGGSGDHVDIVCYFGAPPIQPPPTLVGNLPVQADGTFSRSYWGNAPQ